MLPKNKHLILLNYCRNYCKENSNPLGQAIQGDDSDVLRELFLNYRERDPLNPKGFRLTNIGLQYMKMCFAHWEIHLDGNWRINPKHVIFLDRHCKLPYHLYANILTMFDKEIAIQIKLIGDLDIYMQMQKENRPDLLKKRA
jgi:hypothetical protein